MFFKPGEASSRSASGALSEGPGPLFAAFFGMTGALTTGSLMVASSPFSFSRAVHLGSLR